MKKAVAVFAAAAAADIEDGLAEALAVALVEMNAVFVAWLAVEIVAPAAAGVVVVVAVAGGSAARCPAVSAKKTEPAVWAVVSVPVEVDLPLMSLKGRT